MRELKIYLAGKMNGLSLHEMSYWRTGIKNKLEDVSELFNCHINVINPVDYFNFESKRYQSEKEVEEFDLAHVRTSDIIVVNLKGLDTSDGSKIEIHDANYHYKIPVIAFGDMELYESLHPWIKNRITRVEPDLDSVVNYIRDFYVL